MGQSPPGDSYNEDGNGAVFYQGRGEFGWRFPTQRLFTTEPKRMAAEGDVLMSVRAPVGDLNVAYEDCCIGRGLAAIHSQYPSYCLYLMRSLGKKLDAYNGEGTVFGSINGRTLNGLEIGLPDADAIKAFEAFARPIDKQIRANVKEERCLASLRDALLPKLMSGEIDVSGIEQSTPSNIHLYEARWCLEIKGFCNTRLTTLLCSASLHRFVIRSRVGFVLVETNPTRLRVCYLSNPYPYPPHYMNQFIVI